MLNYSGGKRFIETSLAQLFVTLHFEGIRDGIKQ
jgi:hypothetical protein